MAWYSLYKWFRTFRKRGYINYVSWYKGFLYDKWFESLSEEEQRKELEQQEEFKKQRERDGKAALENLLAMYRAIERVAGGSYYWR